MDKLVVTGGRPFRGPISVSGSKNTALALLAGAVLPPGRSRILHVPKLRDVGTFARVIRMTGADVDVDSEVGVATVELDEDASFNIPAIANGQSIRMWCSSSAEIPAYPMLETMPDLLPGQSLELEIPVKPLVTVTGRILTGDTREGA